MQKNWTDEELTAAVIAYRQMKQGHLGKAVSKRDAYRRLAAQFGRTEKAFEYRMQNISSVLVEMGHGTVPGLLPAANVGANVRKRLAAIIERQEQLERSTVGPQAAYVTKLPAMRRWLIEVARNEGMVSYGDVMEEFGLDRFTLHHALSKLVQQSRGAQEPIITALVVLQGSGRCSRGLRSEFGVKDDRIERQLLYKYWRSPGRIDPLSSSSTTNAEVGSKKPRFSRVEVRPDQRSFRDAVFRAYGGACVISNCTIEATLDAAHKIGRGWRLGYNRAEDGYVLRKDLHALYDATLLKISADGDVTFDLNVQAHYQEFAGVKIRARLF